METSKDKWKGRDANYKSINKNVKRFKTYKKSKKNISRSLTLSKLETMNRVATWLQYQYDFIVGQSIHFKSQ